MAALFGMKLVNKHTFADFFKENLQDKDNLSLLNAMQALEASCSMVSWDHL